MQVPVTLSDIIRANLRFQRHVLKPFFGPWDIDDTINDCVRNVNALGSEILRDGSGKSTQGKLGTRKGGNESVRFDGCCGAGEDEGWRILGRSILGMLEAIRQSVLGENEGALATTCMLVARLTNRTTVNP